MRTKRSKKYGSQIGQAGRDSQETFSVARNLSYFYPMKRYAAAILSGLGGLLSLTLSAQTTPADTLRTSPLPDWSGLVNTQLTRWQDSLHACNRRIETAPGYRIVLYTGPDRAKANQAKEKFYRLMPEATLYTTYKQPTFRVQAGDFLDRLEALRIESRLRAEFGELLVVRERINVNPRKK